MSVLPTRLVALLPLALVLLAQFATARPPIGSSVRLFAPISQYRYICDQVLTKAKQLSGSNAINFLPTQHFVDNNVDKIPDYYCYAAGNIWNPACETANAKARARFQAAMAYCFRKAYSLGFRNFEITPRLDELNQKVWRNEMAINPNAKYGGVNYKQLLLIPIINAVNSVPRKDLKVFFNIQGEMNGPLITYPRQWLQTAQSVKRVVKPWCHVGVNLNFNKICAKCTGANWSPNTQNAGERFDNAGIQALFNSMDFIGMSAYAPLWQAGDSSAYVTPNKIENSVWIANTELKAFGVDLQALNRGGKLIHYSEFGLGGGTCNQGNCAAWNTYDVAKSPFFGIFGDYNPTMDPWKNSDIKNFRTEFYKQTIRYLAGQGKYSWNVEAVYIWNHGSYDVQGVFPGSTNGQGSWADWGVIDMIKKWNAYGQVP